MKESDADSLPESDEREGFSRTSLSLLDRARNRDEAAWQRLVSLYSPLIASWCLRSSLNADETNDVIQDVFSAVAGNLADFRRAGASGTFRGWLRVITRNKIHDHFRRKADEPDAAGGSTARFRLEQVIGPDDEESDADRAELAGVYLRALEFVRNEFETKTWQAFWQVAVEDRTVADVAESLHLSAGAVRQAKYKVLRRLRQELGDLMAIPGSGAHVAEPFE